MQKKEKEFAIILGIITLLVFLAGDERVFLFVNKTLGNDILDHLFLNFFVPLFYILPATALICIALKKYRKTAVFTLIFGGVIYFLSSALKIFFARPRPYEVIELTRIVGSWQDISFSFPSSTTALAFALALPFFFFHKERIFYVHIFLACAIAFFVIYSGYHWPSDALAGIWISLIFLEIFNKLKKFLFTRNFFKFFLFNNRDI